MAFVATARGDRACRRKPYFFFSEPCAVPRPIVTIRESLIDFACRDNPPRAVIDIGSDGFPRIS